VLQYVAVCVAVRVAVRVAVHVAVRVAVRVAVHVAVRVAVIPAILIGRHELNLLRKATKATQRPIDIIRLARGGHDLFDLFTFVTLHTCMYD